MALVGGVTRTMKPEAGGGADGDGDAAGEGEAVGELVEEPGFDGPPHAVRSRPAARTETRIFTADSSSTTHIVRTRLRFGYHPAPEAGEPPLTPRAAARPGKLMRTATQLSVFVLYPQSGGTIRTLNLTEVMSHLV